MGVLPSKYSFNSKEQSKSNQAQEEQIVLRMLTFSFLRNSNNKTEKSIKKRVKQLKTQQNQYRHTYLQEIPSQMIQYLKECRQDQIYLSLLPLGIQTHSNVPNLSKQMATYFHVHIGFPNLIKLHITSQNTFNIQAIQFLQAPNLRCIQMHDNLIVTVKSLAKASFPRLQTISLYRSKVNSLSELCRGNYKRLGSYQLDQFNEDNENQPKEKYMGIGKRKRQQLMQNWSFLFKMQNVNLKKLYAESTKRIIPQDSQLMLQKLNIGANIKISDQISMMTRRININQNINRRNNRDRIRQMDFLVRLD